MTPNDSAAGGRFRSTWSGEASPSGNHFHFGPERSLVRNLVASLEAQIRWHTSYAYSIASPGAPSLPEHALRKTLMTRAVDDQIAAKVDAIGFFCRDRCR